MNLNNWIVDFDRVNELAADDYIIKKDDGFLPVDNSQKSVTKYVLKKYLKTYTEYMERYNDRRSDKIIPSYIEYIFNTLVINKVLINIRQKKIDDILE